MILATTSIFRTSSWSWTNTDPLVDVAISADGRRLTIMTDPSIGNNALGTVDVPFPFNFTTTSPPTSSPTTADVNSILSSVTGFDINPNGTRLVAVDSISARLVTYNLLHEGYSIEGVSSAPIFVKNLVRLAPLGVSFGNGSNVFVTFLHLDGGTTNAIGYHNSI